MRFVHELACCGHLLDLPIHTHNPLFSLFPPLRSWTLSGFAFLREKEIKCLHWAFNQFLVIPSLSLPPPPLFPFLCFVCHLSFSVLPIRTWHNLWVFYVSVARTRKRKEKKGTQELRHTLCWKHTLQSSHMFEQLFFVLPHCKILPFQPNSRCMKQKFFIAFSTKQKNLMLNRECPRQVSCYGHHEQSPWRDKIQPLRARIVLSFGVF